MILSKLSDIFIDLKHPELRIYPGIAGKIGQFVVIINCSDEIKVYA